MTQTNFIEILNRIGISLDEINCIALNSKAFLRNRCLFPITFLFLTCSQSIKGFLSFDKIASSAAIHNDLIISKQAIAKKLNKKGLDFIRSIANKIIQANISQHKASVIFKNKFKRIIIQDSTIIRLPFKLFKFYSGVANASTKVCNARIQFALDIASGEFVHFSIDSYSVNDLKAAPSLIIKEGDLVIRDRGYFILDEIERHVKESANCIYRYKHKTLFLDVNTNAPIDLLSLLNKFNSIDIKVRLNNENRTIVRLLAIPVNLEIANNRRMRLKKELKRNVVSRECLELQSWSIYITTIDNQIATMKDIMDLYRLRWRIEIIFKSWKSNLNFSKIHNVSKEQLEIIIWSRLIMIWIFINMIYFPCLIKINKTKGLFISLLKLTKYLTDNMQEIIKIIQYIAGSKNEMTIIKISKNCTYDKRKKRSNYEQFLLNCFLS